MDYTVVHFAISPEADDNEVSQLFECIKLAILETLITLI